MKPCTHTITIHDSVGTHGPGVIGHNAVWDASDAPNTAQDSAQGRLTPPRAVTPVVDLPSNATPGLTEPSGPPYTPQECEDGHSNAQPLQMPDNNKCFHRMLRLPTN